MCKVCRSGRGSKSLDRLHSPSGLATHLSPSPLLLHLRPPPQPGWRGGAPLTITPSPPSPPATTISTTHHQHHFPRDAPHTTTSIAPSPSSLPRHRSHDLFFPCCSSLLLTSLLLLPTPHVPAALPSPNPQTAPPPRPCCCYSTSSTPLLLL
ncbi:hypothetical protein VPH35_129520 [Triticum aestivum]